MDEKVWLQCGVARMPCIPCRGRGGWQDPEDGQFVSHLDCNGKGWLPAPWLTPVVVGIARDIDENERWDLLPVLADALEDSGCPDEGMVRHLRGWGHCPGCWIVDLLLGNH